MPIVWDVDEADRDGRDRWREEDRAPAIFVWILLVLILELLVLGVFVWRP